MKDSESKTGERKGEGLNHRGGRESSQNTSAADLGDGNDATESDIIVDSLILPGVAAQGLIIKII